MHAISVRTDSDKDSNCHSPGSEHTGVRIAGQARSAVSPAIPTRAAAVGTGAHTKTTKGARQPKGTTTHLLAACMPNAPRFGGTRWSMIGRGSVG